MCPRSFTSWSEIHKWGDIKDFSFFKKLNYFFGLVFSNP
ncbi:uncharacterized protein CHAB577_0509 [Chlamydia abortus]|nr:uncharacterized protein CHAB577_0509 [Chlamydia abortus]